VLNINQKENIKSMSNKEILKISILYAGIYQVENENETTVFFQGSLTECANWLFHNSEQYSYNISCELF